MTEQLPKVWSERRPGAWDQCTEGAYLMALVYGGWRDFPRGIYSDGERNALDEATPPDPATGGSTFDLLDAGARRRYGVTLHRIPGDTKRGLRTQLGIAGQALAIAGSLGHFPVGHRLRKWQPDYTGGHAVAVVTLGEGRCWWGDPLAPMGDAGDEVTVDAVATFAWYPSDARIITGGAFLVGALRDRIARLVKRRDNLVRTVRALRDQVAALTPEQLAARLAELSDLVDALEADLADG